MPQRGEASVASTTEGRGRTGSIAADFVNGLTLATTHSHATRAVLD